MMRAWGWLLAFLSLWGAGAMGDEVEENHRLSLEFVTPHTDWAQPYALGKVRVLFFSSGRDTHAREIVELMQRFDIEADAVYWTLVEDTPNWQWHGGEEGLKRILRLLERPYDVYLFNQIPLTNLPAKAQYQLLKPVVEGAGLVLLGFRDERVFKGENRLQELPPFLQGTEAQAYRVGKGRGVYLPAPPLIPYRFGWEVEYDHWQERLGRAVLWAAGKEPRASLSIAVEPQRFDRDAEQAQLVVRWEGAAGLRLEGRLRRRDDGAVLPLALPASRREEIRQPLPLLRSGSYFAEVWARSGRGVEAWATTTFEVLSRRSIEAIEPQRTWAEVGEAFAGRVRLSRQLGEGEGLELRLKDRQGRIWARLTRRSFGRLTSYHFPVKPWYPMLLQLEAVWHAGRGEVAASSVYLHVVKRNRGRFNFLVWDYPRGPTAPYAEEALARLGMTLQLAGGAPPAFVAAYDVAWVPYTTRILAPLDEQSHMKPVCWNDEPAVEEYIQGIVGKYREARQHGVFVYSLGDETVTRGACLHPACLQAYRLYLAEQYGGDIAALNRAWGTNYRSFDEVEVRDNDEATALREGRFARWFDRQAFQCYNFARFCQRFGDAYRELDPQARTGFEGAGRFDAGDDYDLIVRKNGFWSPYPGPGDEILRSIAPRDFPRANWMGYQKDADSLLRWYWRMVTRGSDAVWWWRWDGIGRFNGLLRPDLSPFPAVKEMLRDTEVLREGLGDLLLASEMEDDGIALLYSFPSAYATRVENGPSFGGYQEHHVAWHRALRDLGLQFHYITDRMVRRGEWPIGRDRMLILARAEALSEEEVRAFRRFVEGGGTLIADLRPGIFDGHCAPRQRGALDDLFGIERAGRGPAAKGKATLSLGGVSLEVPELLHDPHLQAMKATPSGKVGATPLLLRRRVGRGEAVLLNFGLTSYPPLHQADAPEAAAQLLTALLRAAGVQPRYRLTTPQGQRLRNIELIRWRTGGTEILALFRETGEAGEAMVHLPEPRWAYDLRQRRALGRTTTLRCTLRPGRAYFFALLPWEPSPPAFLAPSRATRGQVASLRVRMPRAAGLHALRLRAFLPDGREADGFRPILLVGDEEAQAVLPLAFNDPPGPWRIEAQELFTGQRAIRMMRVEP